MSRLEDGNLLAPMTLPEGEIGNFIKRHVCGLCRGKLAPRFAPDRMYFVSCHIHGNLAEFQTVKTGAAERAEADILNGQHLMSDGGHYDKKTAEEILKTLGF